MDVIEEKLNDFYKDLEIAIEVGKKTHKPSQPARRRSYWWTKV